MSESEVFLQKYGKELENVPYYMRERVAYLIDQKVEKRVKEHMTAFRQEVMAELDEQRVQNEAHIAHYQAAGKEKYFEKQKQMVEDKKREHQMYLQQEHQRHMDQQQKFMEHQRRLEEQHRVYLE